MTTRADMGRSLGLDPNAPTKTIILETHTDSPRGLLEELVGEANVEPTNDAFLYKAFLPDGVIWVDQLDERFWSIHTDLQIHPVRSFLQKEVEQRRELDWMWLPSDHLRNLWPNAVSRRVHTTFSGQGFVDVNSRARDLRVQLAGEHATDLLDIISRNSDYRSSVSFERVQATLTDSELGQIEEGASRKGTFQVTGDSFEFHAQFVRRIVQRYKRLVELCEARAMTFDPFRPNEDGPGGSLRGSPIVVRFSRSITDLEFFLSTLLSSRTPYRLWGVPQISDSYASVHAVDLHVANTVKLDIGDDWMRIYLRRGSCGNTVARLVANLQHTFDGALHFVDPELQDALTGSSVSTTHREAS